MYFNNDSISYMTAPTIIIYVGVQYIVTSHAHVEGYASDFECACAM